MSVERQFLHEVLFRGLDKHSRLGGKVVSMAGCGALGSWTAVFLARMGVRVFRLIDKDRVEVHNVSTQCFTPQDVGQSKVKAVQQMLYRLNGARCETHFMELNERNSVGLLAASDLVVCTFDNKRSREVVKGTCLLIPCVFGAMNGGHMYLEVLWAEDYVAPDDPVGVEVDPCNYPMSTTLVTLTSSLLAEASISFLLDGVRRKGRLGFNEVF